MPTIEALVKGKFKQIIDSDRVSTTIGPRDLVERSLECNHQNHPENGTFSAVTGGECVVCGDGCFEPGYAVRG